MPLKPRKSKVNTDAKAATAVRRRPTTFTIGQELLDQFHAWCAAQPYKPKMGQVVEQAIREYIERHGVAK